MKRNEKHEGVRVSALLRERARKVAELLAKPEARPWKFPAGDFLDVFHARTKVVRPLRDELRILIFGQPRFEHELHDTDGAGRVTIRTMRQKSVEGVADELTDVLAAMGILAGPRPRSDGFHSPLREFVGDALGVRWLVECDTICRHCRALALREVHAVLAAAGARGTAQEEPEGEEAGPAHRALAIIIRAIEDGTVADLSYRKLAERVGVTHKTLSQNPRVRSVFEHAQASARSLIARDGIEHDHPGE